MAEKEKISIPSVGTFVLLSDDDRAKILQKFTEEETWDSLSEEEKEKVKKLDKADLQLLSAWK